MEGGGGETDRESGKKTGKRGSGKRRKGEGKKETRGRGGRRRGGEREEKEVEENSRLKSECGPKAPPRRGEGKGGR